MESADNIYRKKVALPGYYLLLPLVPLSALPAIAGFTASRS